MSDLIRDIAPPARTAAQPAKKPSPWKKIKADTLPANLAALFTEMQEANKIARESKAEFTKAMRACMVQKPGKQLFFSDRFGDLQYAYLDEQDRKSSSSAADFADLVKGA